MNHFTDAQIIGQIDAMLENPGKRSWPLPATGAPMPGADYAGVSRLQYPPNARLIRTMCSGRVDEKFIWHGSKKARR
jgi:heterodisulfide reductase subunit A2